jgi:hypothetical protein
VHHTVDQLTNGRALLPVEEICDQSNTSRPGRDLQQVLGRTIHLQHDAVGIGLEKRDVRAGERFPVRDHEWVELLSFFGYRGVAHFRSPYTRA